MKPCHGHGKGKLSASYLLVEDRLRRHLGECFRPEIVEGEIRAASAIPIRLNVQRIPYRYGLCKWKEAIKLGTLVSPSEAAHGFVYVWL
jgi:hypothetical protein